MPQTPKRRPRGACRGKSGSICSFLKLVVGLYLLYTQPNRRHPGTACVQASASGGAPACGVRGASEEESSSGGWRPLQGLAMEDATFRSPSRAGTVAETNPRHLCQHPALSRYPQISQSQERKAGPGTLCSNKRTGKQIPLHSQWVSTCITFFR